MAKLTLDDLKKLREAKKGEIQKRISEGKVSEIIVGMGTCGIAAGARDTMKAILDEIEKENLSGVIVTQTGCMGLCEKEPIVQVIVGEGPKTTYGKVSPDVARQILKDHVVGGKVVEDHVIQI